ncbi:MAG: 2-hydroxyacid dehydrogenase [Gammaproteobacteria bacterium]|nr:2-hydroxyacid dehydrogenase [Gammaproteobacteria bacterium]
MKGVILDEETFDTGDLDLTALERADVEWTHYPRTTSAQRIERLRGAVVAVSNKVRIDEDCFAACPELRLVCVAATGTNNVDLEAAARHGVTVTNARGYATPSVTQHVFSLLLSLVTRQSDYRAAVTGGRWQTSPDFCLLDFPITELAGKVLGIVGYGELGHAVAGVARAFGMEVSIAARPGTIPGPDRIALADLLPRVDVLSLHCPLTEQTRNLIAGPELALMKPTAILINTARGGIVEETALANALRAGRLGGAGVDVLSVEPPRDGNPLLDTSIPNLIVTPHIAWASRESRQRLVEDVAENILAWQRGESRNVVSS